MPDFAALSSAWREADIIPVPQPVFIYTFGEFIPHYVGEYARDKQFPQRSLLDDGWRISGSSDVWVGGEIGQTNPFLSIASCVERRTYHGHELSPDQRISVYEALRMHTLDAAYAMGVEQTPGSLEVGKFTDILALQRNSLKTPATELDSIAVREVFLGGRRVHSSTT